MFSLRIVSIVFCLLILLIEYFIIQAMSKKTAMIVINIAGYGNSKCWYLLDKIEYENNKLRFYIDGYWSFPPDYGECDCSQIPSKVLWCALKEFKKHITHLERNTSVDENLKGDTSVDDNAEKAVSIDEIMLFLKEKGYQPQRYDEGYIVFKFQGEPYEIHYGEPLLSGKSSGRLL